MWPLSCFHFFLGKESNRQTREKKQKAPSFGGKCRFRLVVFPFVGFIKPNSEYENLTPFFLFEQKGYSAGTVEVQILS